MWVFGRIRALKHKFWVAQPDVAKRIPANSNICFSHARKAAPGVGHFWGNGVWVGRDGCRGLGGLRETCGGCCASHADALVRYYSSFNSASARGDLALHGIGLKLEWAKACTYITKKPRQMNRGRPGGLQRNSTTDDSYPPPYHGSTKP